MDAIRVLQKHISPETALYPIVYEHSRLVAEKALLVAKKHPELGLDVRFLYEASLLHDVGVYRTNAPEIGCFGLYPYICHGYLGRELLEMEGFPRHALVCERHTGTGLTLSEIVDMKLPLPHRDMLPRSLEEQVVCFADKFFSKSEHNVEHSLEQIRRKLEKHGEWGPKRFDVWCEMFL